MRRNDRNMVMTVILFLGIYFHLAIVTVKFQSESSVVFEDKI